MLSSEAFVTQYRPLEQPHELPKASVTPSLRHYEQAYPDCREAMARAFRTGVCIMRDIAAHFRVHYATVSRAVRWLEENVRPMRNCKT